MSEMKLKSYKCCTCQKEFSSKPEVMLAKNSEPILIFRFCSEKCLYGFLDAEKRRLDRNER